MLKYIDRTERQKGGKSPDKWWAEFGEPAFSTLKGALAGKHTIARDINRFTLAIGKMSPLSNKEPQDAFLESLNGGALYLFGDLDFSRFTGNSNTCMDPICVAFMQSARQFITAGDNTGEMNIDYVAVFLGSVFQTACFQLFTALSKNAPFKEWLYLAIDAMRKLKQLIRVVPSCRSIVEDLVINFGCDDSFQRLLALVVLDKVTFADLIDQLSMAFRRNLKREKEQTDVVQLPAIMGLALMGLFVPLSADMHRPLMQSQLDELATKLQDHFTSLLSSKSSPAQNLQHLIAKTGHAITLEEAQSLLDFCVDQTRDSSNADLGKEAPLIRSLRPCTASHPSEEWITANRPFAVSTKNAKKEVKLVGIPSGRIFPLGGGHWKFLGFAYDDNWYGFQVTVPKGVTVTFTFEDRANAIQVKGNTHGMTGVANTRIITSHCGTTAGVVDLMPPNANAYSPFTGMRQTGEKFDKTADPPGSKGSLTYTNDGMPYPGGVLPPSPTGVVSVAAKNCTVIITFTGSLTTVSTADNSSCSVASSNSSSAPSGAPLAMPDSDSGIAVALAKMELEAAAEKLAAAEKAAIAAAAEKAAIAAVTASNSSVSSSSISSSLAGIVSAAVTEAIATAIKLEKEDREAQAKKLLGLQIALAGKKALLPKSGDPSAKALLEISSLETQIASMST